MKTLQHPDFGECVELSNNSLRALIAPGMGMALVDFAFNGMQILDASRKEQFLSCRKGLGPLILPHFNQEGKAPNVKPADFPHIAALSKLGVKHPFQHGAGRYAAWPYDTGDNYVRGTLKGSDKLNGSLVRDIAGFDFSAEVTYILGAYDLLVCFDVSGQAPVTAGIHFYYDLKDAAASKVTLPVEGEEENVTVKLDQDLDNVYIPKKDRENAMVVLETGAYKLETAFKVTGRPEETFDSVTVFSPAKASFVCVEPLAHVPGKPGAKKRFKGAIALVPKKNN
jgi:galactose mutarotase-like enzyme